MQITVPRAETLKGAVLGTGACVISLIAGARMQQVTGSAGLLMGLLLGTVVAS